MTGSRASQLYRTKRLSGGSPAAPLAALVLALTAVLAAAPASAASPQSDALARARLLYNQRQYDQAIQTAEKALSAPGLADSARVVIGRSYLERFRQSANDADLEAGRAALRQVQTTTLAARDRADLLIGLGECLYLNNDFGPAAELFSSAVEAVPPGEVHDSVLDWWASSVERVAFGASIDDRVDYYWDIAYRMDDELKKDPSSAPASYWLAAASRGRGDVERAWDAALAGWVRSLLSPSHGAALRADLDHLMETAIIPERARMQLISEGDLKTPVPQADVDKRAGEIANTWLAFKEAWK